ncbi:uncharacterized protein LOC106081521 [Stomoxys calcitrans]|uniref:uncharacterized protein LOC106081521 n=1 Tax=Stomoxys calcitrans TaxID=35570 RepID=UPI0027E3AEB6|nr:uncharacterized protein LOC106081521 [Stomoxys calcitrans]
MATNNVSKNLKDLTPQEFTEFFNSFDLVLCDCDGVLWMGCGLALPRAVEGVQLLKDKGKLVKFVSNNSMRSDQQYAEKFVQLGMRDYKVAKTMAWYLKNINPEAIVYPLLTPAAIEALLRYGIRVVPKQIDMNALTFSNFTQYMVEHDPPRVDAVIADAWLATSFAHLVKALQYLKDPKCQLILGAMDAMLPVNADLAIPGFLDFYEFLKKYSNKTPITMGKPSKLLEEFVKHCFAITNPQRCLFIGDSLKSDISFGRSAGFQTLFVCSGGIDNEEAMLNTLDDYKPDYYTNSVADFIDLLP